MDEWNQTSVRMFILLGLTEDPELQVPLFLLFFLVYIFTIACNIGISTLIIMESKLHTPMFFFISNLSMSDVFYTSVITPKMLKDLLSEKKAMSFVGCATQTFLFVMFAGFGGYMLSAMSYDRYAAICHPLLYPLLISRSVCIQLVTVVYISGIISAASLTVCTFHASFCGSNIIDHFYCDAPPLMALSCSDRFVREIALFAVTSFFGAGSLLITVTSYIYIIATIFQIPSTAGRQKTFSTCGSHLTSLSLLYVTGLFSYLSLPGSRSATQNKVVSVCYTILIPMLNPLIYSLRNQEVKGVMWTIVQKKSKVISARFQNFQNSPL